VKRRYSVVQWSVGGVGRQALGAILRNRDFELLGVYTHTTDRSGRDAGELAGLGIESGIRASSDADALLDLHPDCVVFTSIGESRPREAVADLVGILRSGANVVSSSMMNLIYPPAADSRPIAKLAEACIEGGSTLFTSGIDPGFSGDALPMAALQICERVDTIRVQELSDYGTHTDASWTTPYGFGKPEGAAAPILEPGVPTLFWGGMIGMLSRMLDVELEGVEEFCDRWYTTESFDAPIGHFAAGTLAAVRFGVAGIVHGEPRLFAEHVTRMRHDMGPHWPQPPAGITSVHRVAIEGSPSLTLDLSMRSEALGSHDSTGLLATAMRLVNAILAVVSAPPGIATPLDLTLGIGRSLLATGSEPPGVL
jgi:4-hydroxy-tetrahydrodipicolinate reductase